MEEAAFRALADPSRRRLLDRLFEREGQSLEELCAHLPGMTRFGVMKHLRVLEAAGLVATRRVGREKLHYLNPVPIRLIHDRWISKYAEPWARALADLKNELEESTMDRPRHVYEVYIRATPERIWQAIVDPELTRGYFFGTLVQVDLRPGGAMRYDYPDGRPAAEGVVLESDPPRRLVHTFDARWDEEVTGDRPHRVTWEIEPMGAVCKLTVVHDDFDGETATSRSVTGGLAVVVSGLKTLIETGEPLPMAAGS